nr:RNA-directed DNA polymerase, eukaryota, reverse transcriptase zinc-binding domain protein [Tanacetum cinerariifolium]
LEIVNSINELEKQQAMETAQKAKIKWVIKGDENSKYYHGILNKKRNNLAIRGVLEAEKLIENLDLVKKEFLNHLKNRFGRPNKTRHVLVTEFPRQLNSVQRTDMEADVTIEEIKNVVWDCGTDKSPRPDGFSFKFYRRFWSVIQKDVVAANFVDAGMFKGIVLNWSMVLSHMFFADDAVFVGQWSNSNIYTIIYALKCFERASGLRMNMSKSKIMGIAVNGDKVDQVAHRIRCGILEVPFTYLGSKVGGCMSRIQNWNDVVENMSSRLSKWKMKTLSIRGRLTLIKAVLGAMPIYHMSIFKVPLGVLKRMESIRCRFFNGADLDSNSLAWKVRLNGLPSRVNISRRGIDINSILCPICEREVESVSHVFFSCYIAKDNFKKVCRWWNVDFAEVSSYDEWLLWIPSLRIHGSSFYGEAV